MFREFRVFVIFVARVAGPDLARTVYQAIQRAVGDGVHAAPASVDTAINGFFPRISNA